MSYFIETTTYATYSGNEADFHFMYNANSGGGQAFLGGKFYDENGRLSSPETLNGKTALFKFAFMSSNQELVTIVLDDEVTKYDIKPRGNGSSSMKLGIGNDRIAPSKAISAFMMLPPTCGVKTPGNLEWSILSSNNYWLQSMWLESSINNDNQGEVFLQPKDLVFCGGVDKDSNDDTGRYFILDAAKRFSDIVTLSQKVDKFSENIATAISTFTDLYLGQSQFDYNKCSQAIKVLMTELASEYPERYSGIADPLPLLLEIASEEHDAVNEVQPNPALYEEHRLTTGANVLFYGVPGSGKSWTIEHEYCHRGSFVERLVFHPDYTNADFIGQILPVVDEDKQVSYEFTLGPFTSILKKAYTHPTGEYILIIEEINRGNAPAIFGEIFQLLDRLDEAKTEEGITYPVGTSEYGVTHKYMAESIYGDPSHKVRIPSNLSIVGTMNTSDQNVFTLDTAFQRRWNMRLIENNFDNVRPSLANEKILDTDVTWQLFCEEINKIIIGNKTKMASAEDKRLGVYFVHESSLTFDEKASPSDGYTNLLSEYNELLGKERTGEITDAQKQRLDEIRTAVKHNRIFPEKVIKYLWDDAFKFNPEALFDTDKMESLEQVIRTFVYSEGHDRFKIFKNTVYQSLYPNT